MTDGKITQGKIEASNERQQSESLSSKNLSFEESKSIFDAAVRKSFFLIEAKLEAVKAVWEGLSGLQTDSDKLALLLNEEIIFVKHFATYSCNPFSKQMMRQSSQQRSSVVLLQAILEQDKSKRYTPRPPTDAFKHLIVHIGAIRSLVFSMNIAEMLKDDAEDECVELLSSLIAHVEKTQRSIEALWNEHFVEP